MRIPRTSHWVAIATVSVASVGLIATALHRASWTNGQQDPPAFGAGYAARAGDEVLFVFIGGSFCAGSKYVGLRESVGRLERALRVQAETSGKLFTTIGVALDDSTELGAHFLHEFGEFDEIVVGHNWLNSAVVKYVWRDIPGDAALPQVLLLERHLDHQSDAITVGPERLLARTLGADRIMLWADRPDFP